MPNFDAVRQNIKYAFIKTGGILNIILSRIITAIKIHLVLYRLLLAVKVLEIVLRITLANTRDVIEGFVGKARAINWRWAGIEEVISEVRSSKMPDFEIRPNELDSLETLDQLKETFIKKLRLQTENSIYDENKKLRHGWRKILDQNNNKLTELEGKIDQYLKSRVYIRNRIEISNRYAITFLRIVFLASIIAFPIVFAAAATSITASSLWTILEAELISELIFTGVFITARKLFPWHYQQFLKNISPPTVREFFSEIGQKFYGQDNGEAIAEKLYEAPLNTVYETGKNACTYAFNTMAEGFKTANDTYISLRRDMRTDSNEVAPDIERPRLTRT